jgi:hypothetical protein
VLKKLNTAAKAQNAFHAVENESSLLSISGDLVICSLGSVLPRAGLLVAFRAMVFLSASLRSCSLVLGKVVPNYEFF